MRADVAIEIKPSEYGKTGVKTEERDGTLEKDIIVEIKTLMKEHC